MFPALFLSHGAPTLPLVEAPATAFLRQLGDCRIVTETGDHEIESVAKLPGR